MTTILLAVVATGALYAGMLLLNRYVEGLPEAPACPTCRTTTRQSLHARLVDLIPALSMTVVCECQRCGWKGRMRWRWAVDYAQGS